jgi:DNA repair photolyase
MGSKASAYPKLVSSEPRLSRASEESCPSLPKVKLVERRGPVLHPSPLPEHDGVLSLNLTRGCGMRCPFCSVRAQPNYPGDDILCVYRDTAKDLDRELRQRRGRPAAVLISPSSDPFPPLERVQRETGRIVGVLASHGIQAWFMTRGFIRPSIRRVLAEHAEHIRVMTELTTLDRSLQRILEPLTAPPRLRLRQILRLREMEIPVEVGLQPLIPGLTDTPANLSSLLEALAAVGVREVTAGYLFLRKTIGEHLQQAFPSKEMASEIIESYTNGPILASGAIAPARYLPKKYRQRGYAALKAIAAGYGITVRVSATTNPDFQTGRPAAKEESRRQNALPLFVEAGIRTSLS